MKIIMGADPAGFELKNAIKADLLKKGYDITDIDPEAPVLFQEAAVAVATGTFRAGNNDRGHCDMRYGYGSQHYMQQAQRRLCGPV